MPLNDSANNDALGGLSSTLYVGVNTQVPDSSGSGEVTGGTYTRVALSLAAASGSTRASSATLAHNIPAGTTAATYTLWTSLTGGAYKGWAPVAASGALKGSGTVITADISADTVTSPAHGLAVDNRVIVVPQWAGSLPAGLSATTIYYVKAVTTDGFTLSTTSGGTVVDITGKGSLFWFQCSPEVFTNAGTLSVASGSLVFDATLAKG